jgi:hypothetical protein
LAALLLAACNILPGLQPKPFTGALDLPSPLQTVAPGGQVQVPVRATFNDSRVASVTLTVRLADPCAKGTSYCPGWDASRYPGVAHPTESYTLTPASPSATIGAHGDLGSGGDGLEGVDLGPRDGALGPRDRHFCARRGPVDPRQGGDALRADTSQGGPIRSRTCVPGVFSKLRGAGTGWRSPAPRAAR